MILATGIYALADVMSGLFAPLFAQWRGVGGGDPVLIDGTDVTDSSGVDLIGGADITITFNTGASPDTASWAVNDKFLRNDGDDETTGTITTKGLISSADDGLHGFSGNNTIDYTGEQGEGWHYYQSTKNLFLRKESGGTFAEEVATNSANTLTNKTIELDGIPDSDDTYLGITINSYNAGENLTQWDTVYFHASDPDKLHQADADAAGEFPARGIVVATASDTNAAIILTQGSVRNDAWSWAPGETIYLSDTAGGLTSTAPSTSGDCVQIMGWATATDTMYVNVSGHYLEVE